MKRILATVIMLILFASMFPVFMPNPKAGGTETTIFQDDFESYAVGSFPSGGWSLTFNGAGNQYQIISNSYSHSSSQSLQLLGRLSWTALANRGFSHAGYNVIGYEVFVMSPRSDCDAYVGFYNRNLGTWGTSYAAVGIRYGVIGGGGVSVPFAANTWYKIRVEEDKLSRVWSFWINDVLVGQNLAEANDPSQILTFEAASGWTGTLAYFDDVKVFGVARDFEVSVSPSTAPAFPRESSSFTVTVTSLDGFNSPVMLSADVDTAELTATFSSPTVTPPADGSTQSTMKVSVLSTQLTTHTILVYGISGAVSHFVSVNLKVPFLSVPYYYQGDTGWCGPTSTAMVAKYYGISVHPWDVAKAMGQGHDEGTLLADFIIDYLADISLSGTEKDANFDEIKAMLDANKPVIIGVPWTLQHFFVITGYQNTASGSDAILYVNDPSGYLFDYLNSGGADYEYSNPYVQDAILWSDLVGAILPGSFIIGVSGNGHTPSPIRGTLCLVGGGNSNGPPQLQTISVKHEGLAHSLSDVYIWESGWESTPILDTLGLTWRNSPTHSRSLDPSDYIYKPFTGAGFCKLIVNPTDELQNYYFEITFSKGGVQEWTSGRLSSPVSSCSHADPSLANDLKIGTILSEYGQYTIKLLLYTSAGALIDEIDLPPISYVARSLLTVTAHCPAYLDLYDEQGNCVGYNATSGTIETQIDNAIWLSNQTILVFNPSGTYSLEVTGTDNGTFTSETSWQDVTGTTAIISDFTSTITENETQVYTLGADPNVALMNTLPSKTVVCQGFGLQVNATVADLSGANATTDVTLYANGTIIGTQNALNISEWDSANVCFALSSTGLAYGNYTISAYAWPVLGETNTADNNFTGDWIRVTIVGDVNGDGKVNVIDVFAVALAYGSYPGRPMWDPNFDINSDGKINVIDYFMTALNYGKTDT